MTLDRPILVTGTPRCGKSCVTHILNHLPEFCRVKEPLMIWDAGLGSRRDDRRTACEATPALRETILRGCAAVIRNEPGTRYLDDLAYHALRIPFILELMPEARIIHVVRDADQAVPEMIYGWTYKDTVGKAILRRRNALRLRTLPRLGARFIRNLIKRRVSGRRATWGPRVPGLEAFAADHRVEEVAAYQWQQMVKISLNDLSAADPDRWMQIRFEDLLADPKAQARRIGEFCRVASIADLEGYAQSYIDPHHQFDKRADLNPEQWQAIHEITAELQHQLGYADNI
jgi:Sulfotransferase family